MRYEDRIRITTPEGVDLDIALAGLGSRAAAGFVDQVIQMFAYVAFVLVLIAPFADSLPLIAALGISILFVVHVGYHVAFEVLGSGRSPGKRLLGLRVVREGGSPVSFRESAIRNALRIVDAELTLYAAGMVSVLVSAKNQRLGDMAAGTIVIRERSGAPTSPAPRVDMGAEIPSWDVGGVTDDDLIAVRLFLERREHMDPAARLRIAQQLATRLRPRVSGAPDDMGAEGFLWSLYTVKLGRL